METNILRHLQLVELEMLKTFDKICNDNSLKYYLVGGTLLGAVRHQGFIPWDDDLDVAMPRASYNEFIKLCSEGVLGEKYYLQSTVNEPHYCLPFAKIRKNNTLFDEDTYRELKDFHKGIFIDIFPLDYAQNNNGVLFHLKARAIKQLIGVINNRVLNRTSRSTIQKILQFLLSCYKTETLIRMRDRLMQSCKSGDYYINYGSNYRYTKQTMPIFVYEPAVRVKFEDGEFFAPHEYEQYLVNLFNDWRKLPPEEERRNHNPVNIVFDTKNMKAVHSG